VPAFGRFFARDEDRSGADRVVVLSHDFWRDHFASDRGIVGRTLFLDGDVHTIVGVARPGFTFPDPRVCFWVPYAIRPTGEQTRTVVFTALARLKPGMAVAHAEAEGTAAARRVVRHPLADFFFGKGGPVVVHVRHLAADMTTAVRPALTVLAGAVGFVLLISCANVSNLMLARGVSRRRELAVRAALGGSRSRIVRQLLTESFVLASAGGLLGLWVAWCLVRLTPLLAPPSLPRLDEVHLNGEVVGFCVLATIAAALASGVAPALRAASSTQYDDLREADGSRTTSSGSHARRLTRGLLLAEAAFATILVVGAGLLTHSLVRLMTVDNGYVADRVLTAAVELPAGAGVERMEPFVDAILARLRTMPGVVSAGGGNMIPLMRRSAVAPFTLPPGIAGNKPASGRALMYTVTPGYAETLGIRLREGRFFDDRDGRDGQRVVIVNEAFVRQHISVTPVVGLRLPHLFSDPQSPETQIVGVVGDVLKDGNDREPQPEVYVPHRVRSQAIVGQVQLVVRVDGDPTAFGPDLRRLARALEPGAAIDRVEPLTAALAASLDQPRFAATVLSSFAILAVIMAVVGLHGVLSFTVSQKRRELGVRAALGARRSDLISIVLREGLLVTLVGVTGGLIAAAGLAQFAKRLLFGIETTDVAAFTIGPCLLVMMAVAACVRPAMHAASADPASVLRGE
jgi:putative ABC transport system permease protein